MKLQKYKIEKKKKKIIIERKQQWLIFWPTYNPEELKRILLV